MTKRFVKLTSWVLLAFLPTSFAFAAPAGQLAESSGYVTVAAPQDTPKSVGKGATVDAGQVVTTGANGQAVIKFQDGQVVALKSNSIFKVNAYKYEQAAPEKGESFFSLLQGGLRAITGLIGSSNKAGWKLATPTATIGIRGTDFLVVIQQGTYVTVKSGAVTGVNFGGSTLVDVGQTVLIDSGSKVGVLLPLDQIPAGLFTELEGISLGSAVGGSAAGAAGLGGATVGGVPVWVIGVGVAAGAAAAAGGGGSTSTTTHH